MDYIYGKLNFEIKKVEYKGTTTETTKTTVVTSEEANEISVDVLKVSHVLNILDKNDETTTTFDGSSNKSIILHSYTLTENDKETLSYGSFAEYTFLKDGEQEGSVIKIPNVLNTDFTITPLRSASQMFESFGSNKLNLQSSVLKTIAPGPAYFNNSSGALTNGQQGFAFSVDGTKMFTVDTSSDLLYQYTLGTAWDINTLVIPATLSVDIKTVDNTINGVYFKPDGTKIFMIGSSTKGVFSATLSTPWDISTLNEFSTTTGLIANKAYTSLMLSTDGLKLYVGNSTDDKIDIYYLNTAWDTGSILDSIISSIDVSAQEGTITGFFIGNDGETLFIVGSESDRVYQYTMSAPWGDTAVYADKFIETQQGTTTDVQFKPDGSRMFLIGTTTRRVDEYIVPSNWDLYGGQAITKEIKDSFYLRTVIDTDNESSKLEVGTKDEIDVSVPLLTIDKNGNIKSKMSANGAHFNLGIDEDTIINAGHAGISLTAETGIDINSKLKIKADVVDNLDSEGLDGQALTKQNDNVVWSDSFVKTTWQELKDKRDAGLLTAGAQYRITDYMTTTTQADTQSAEHQFDIIVTADDVDKLNENARAVQHEVDKNEELLSWFEHRDSDYPERFFYVDSVVIEGLTLYRWVSYEELNTWNSQHNPSYLLTEMRDVGIGDIVWGFQVIDDGAPTHQEYEEEDMQRIINKVGEGYMSEPDYFDNSKLEAWKLKYCLDNDVNRFAWADEVNGKGVIYRMIDEFENDIPYDFKNIKFLRDGVYYFTFTWVTEDNTIWDASIHSELTNDENQGSRVFGNIIPLTKSRDTSNLYILNDNVFIADYDDDGGIFYGWRENIAKDYFVGNNFGDGCYNNTFGEVCDSNNFGNDCYSNNFGDYFSYNTFGNNCRYNTFGKSCTHNTFDNYCYNNIFGNDCYDNSFSDNCYSNTFGDNCSSNNFDNDCRYNTFDNGCNSNTFGSDCYSNTFDNECYSNIFGNECRYNTFGNECHSNTFGDSCYSNTFVGRCNSNTFGNSCYGNTFGSSCSLNTFGDRCDSNAFSNRCYGNTFRNACNHNTFGNSCYFLRIGNTSLTAKQNIHVENSIWGFSISNQFELYDTAMRGKNYQVTFKKSTSGKHFMLWFDDFGFPVGKYTESILDTVWKDLPHDIDGGIW